jgi:hypothetical protein
VTVLSATTNEQSTIFPCVLLLSKMNRKYSAFSILLYLVHLNFQKEVICVVIAILLFRGCDGYPGWFPNAQGWYPEIQTLRGELSEKILSDWRPTEQRFCEELKPDWHSFREDRSPSTIVILAEKINTEIQIDVKYIDDSYIIDETFKPTAKNDVFIIPPFKPIRWLLLRGGVGSFVICRYRESSIKNSTHTEQSKCASRCQNILSNISPQQIYLSKFPRKLAKPIHEFFLTAETVPEYDDITITTMCTVDRMIRIQQMAELYRGPISAAIYISEPYEEQVAEIMSYWLRSDVMRKYVDIHLVVDDKIVTMKTGDRPFPVNILRNVGIRYARTIHVFYVEADFVPNAYMRHSKHFHLVKERLKANPKAVYLVAGFITWSPVLSNPKYDIFKLPKDRNELYKSGLYNEDPHDETGIQPLSTKFSSHQQFPYSKWKTATEIWELSVRAGGFEPYYISNRNYPLFDEVFIGCGQDKIVHFTELMRAGYEVFVVPDIFILHLDSKGMGTSWCKSLAARFPKNEAFQRRLAEEYGPERPPYLDRIAWWDEGALTLSSLSSKTSQMKTESTEKSEVQSKMNQNSELQVKELEGKWQQEKELNTKLQNELAQLHEEISQKQRQIEITVQRATLTVFGSICLVTAIAFFVVKWKVNNKKHHPL